MIPDEAVEAAAIAHHGIITGGGTGEWGYLDKQSQDNRQFWMRAALEAAAPHMMAAAWDEGRESMAHDYKSPKYDGTLYATPNPYKKRAAK